MNYAYDILFLGGGLNYAGAVVAARAGLKCAIVEKNPDHLGGTCLHNGCIPSKMYLAAAETVRAARKPWLRGEISLQMDALDEAKEKLLERATKAIARQCEGVEILEGEGILTAPHTVEVGQKRVTGRFVVLGTGSKPFIPEGIEYDGQSVVTSDEVLNMTSLPKKVAVYGAGAIGLEMASFFAASGVETELFWRKETLLPKAHPTISQNLAQQMKELGVALNPGRAIESAKPTKRGVHIVFEDGSERYVPTLLVATGRRPDTSAVRTDAVQVGKKGILTDVHFETTCPGHYAVGDCNGKLELAHAARAEVLYVVKRILGQEPEPLDLARVVKFVHTLPCSYATVGFTRPELQKRGIKYKESVVPLRGLPFPHTHDADEGVMVLYADEEGFVAGGELFCPGAEELVAAVAMALAGELDAATASRTILAHPTFSESLERAFSKL